MTRLLLAMMEDAAAGEPPEFPDGQASESVEAWIFCHVLGRWRWLQCQQDWWPVYNALATAIPCGFNAEHRVVCTHDRVQPFRQTPDPS